MSSQRKDFNYLGHLSVEKNDRKFKSIFMFSKNKFSIKRAKLMGDGQVQKTHTSTDNAPGSIPTSRCHLTTSTSTCVGVSIVQVRSAACHKTAVTPLLTHWSYHSLALSHWDDLSTILSLRDFLCGWDIFTLKWACGVHLVCTNPSQWATPHFEDLLTCLTPLGLAP